MGLLSSIGKAVFGDPTKGIKKATDQNLAFQREGLDYMKEAQAPLLGAQKFGLEQLQGYYDPTDPTGQQAIVTQAQQSPFFQSMQQQGEEAILRNQAATGGLRTGSTQQALAQNSQNVLQSLVNQNLQGLGGLASVNVNPAQVAGQYSQMGQTQGAGTTAVNQANQAAGGQLLGTLLGGAQLAGGLGWNPFGK